MAVVPFYSYLLKVESEYPSFSNVKEVVGNITRKRARIHT